MSLYGSRFHPRLPLPKARGALIGVARVRAECARRRELSQLVTYHIFGDIHRDELVAVVHGQRVSHEVRRDRRSPGPSAQHLLVTRLVHTFDLVGQMTVDEGTLLDRARHGAFPSLFLLAIAAPQNPGVGRLLPLARLVTLGGLAPRGNRVSATRGLALTTTVRVIDGIHDHAADLRPTTEPA